MVPRVLFQTVYIDYRHINQWYILSEAWSGVNWADLMASQGAIGTDFYDRSILRPSIVPTIVLVEKIGPKGALGSHEIRPIHSAPSLGQSIALVIPPCRFCEVMSLIDINSPKQQPVFGWLMYLSSKEPLHISLSCFVLRVNVQTRFWE